MNGYIGTAAIVAAVVTSVGWAPAALAADPSNPVVVTGHDDDLVVRRVSYADLNLSDQQAQKTLHKRVGFAVTQVCNEATGPSPILWAETNCRQGAWSSARPQIAKAIDRAEQIARYGTSSIPMVAIRISIGQ